MASSHVVTDGQRNGLLTLLPHKTLSQRDLRTTPADALVATVLCLDVDEVFDEAIRLISQFEPNAAEEFERVLWKVETHLGVNIEDDILSSLDDVWVAYLPDGDLLTSRLGSAAAVRVKDAQRLQMSIDKLVALAQANTRN